MTNLLLLWPNFGLQMANLLCCGLTLAYRWLTYFCYGLTSAYLLLLWPNFGLQMANLLCCGLTSAYRWLTYFCCGLTSAYRWLTYFCCGLTSAYRWLTYFCCGLTSAYRWLTYFCCGLTSAYRWLTYLCCGFILVAGFCDRFLSMALVITVADDEASLFTWTIVDNFLYNSNARYSKKQKSRPEIAAITGMNTGVDFGEGQPGRAPPITEKRPFISQFLPHFSPNFGLPLQYLRQVYASGMKFYKSAH